MAQLFWPTLQSGLCICLSVCLSAGHNGVPNKMAEPIKGPFALWTIICGGQDSLEKHFSRLYLGVPSLANSR